MTTIERPHLRVVEPPGPAPRRPSRRGAVVVVAFAILLSLLGWLLFTGHSPARQPPATPKAVTRPVATHPQRKPVPAVTACHLSARDQRIPTTAPAGVTWDIYETVALPYSRAAGPEYVNGGVARCYAHDPVGALIADVQIGSRYLISPAWRAVVASQVVPGPGAKVYSAERPTVSSNANAGDYCQVAGFSVLSYTSQRAQIEAVSRCGSLLQATTSVVEWSGTDWRLTLQPDGGESPAATQIANLTGFVPWGGV